MIDRFIQILRGAGLEPTAYDIADMLALALVMPAPVSGTPVKPDDATRDETVADTEKDTEKKKQDEKKITDTPPADDKGTNVPDDDALKPGDVLTGNEDAGDGDSLSSVPFRAPQAPALPGARKIAAALRPLRRTYPSTRHFILDEEQTVTQIADGGPFAPAMKPAPERWLDLALVFDDSMTMQVWRPALLEIRRLLERSGVFRDVRAWVLDTDQARAALRLGSPEEMDETVPARGANELADAA
ncbi:MAG: hypothetical protein ACKV2V_15865, partial [Blastocatellia bacterium]